MIPQSLTNLLKVIYDPKNAFDFGHKMNQPGIADDGLSLPSEIENNLRHTPIVNALFGHKIADQMSADRWTQDYYTLTGNSPSNDYYPHLSGLQYGGSGAMAVYSALKNGVSAASSVAPTPYALDNQSNEKMKQIYG